MCWSTQMANHTYSSSAEVADKFKNVLTFGMLIFLIVAIILPMISLFRYAFIDPTGRFVGIDNFVIYFQSPNLSVSVLNTIFVSSVTTVISVTLGFLYAYGISRTAIKFKSIYHYMIFLPLFAPTMLYGIGLVYLFGFQGVITNGFFGLLPFTFELPIYGALGIIISEVLYTLPQTFLLTYVALSNTDYRMYEAADMLGASQWEQFRTITLPNAKYGIISAMFVAFSLSFTDFGAPKVIGGNFNVLATDVYKQVVGQHNFSMGAVVSILLMLPSLLSLIIDKIAKNRDSVNAKSKPFVCKKNKKQDIFFEIYCAMISFGVLAFLLIVLVASLVQLWPYDLTPTLSNFTFTNLNGSSWEFYFNSIMIALFTAIFGTAITFLSAYLIEKNNSFTRVRRLTYLVSLVPLTLPGMVIGISYILFFNAKSFDIFGISIANPFNGIYGTWMILILANIVHLYTSSFLMHTTSLKKQDKEYESISASMNIPWYKTFFKVNLPLSNVSILESFSYLFVQSMVTISAVVFLYTPTSNLASVAIVNLSDRGEVAKAAAMGILIIITNILVRLIIDTTKSILKKRRK